MGDGVDPVHSWTSPPGAEYPLSMGLKVMFDSSHFAPGTFVNVRFRVRSALTGLWHEGNSSPDPIVKNQIMMFEDQARRSRTQ